MHFEGFGAFYVKDKGENGNRGATPCHSVLIPDLKIDPIIISCESNLFLGGRLLISLGLGTLLADTLVAGLATGITKTAVGSLLTLGEVVTLDLSNGLLGAGVLNGEGGTDTGDEALRLALSKGGLGSVDLLSGRVKLLELTALAGEENQASLVVLEAGNIGDERLLRVVDTAVVNGDTDGASELLGDTSFLKCGERSCKPLTMFEVRPVARAISDSSHPLMILTHRDEFTFSSARVKPRPARTRRLYLTVGQRTTGRNWSTGRGATAAALARRASRRRCLRPGYCCKNTCQSTTTTRNIF